MTAQPVKQLATHALIAWYWHAEARRTLPRCRRLHPGSNLVNAHRAVDVFKALLAKVLELGVNPAWSIVVYAARYADPSGLGERLKPCRYVDAVAVNILPIDNDVTDIYSDSEL